MSRLEAHQVSAVLRRGATARRNDGQPPRFARGDRVRVLNRHPYGHTRMPRYVRGCCGIVDRDHGLFVLPDSNAQGLGECPQHVYSVRFTGVELWGSEAPAADRIYVDLWDCYLTAEPDATGE